MKLLAGNSNPPLARSICDYLEVPLTDASVRRFFDGETKVVPDFYVDRIRRDLGPLWPSLPAGGLAHDPEAYIKSADAPVPITLSA